MENFIFCAASSLNSITIFLEKFVTRSNRFLLGFTIGANNFKASYKNVMGTLERSFFRAGITSVGSIYETMDQLKG